MVFKKKMGGYKLAMRRNGEAMRRGSSGSERIDGYTAQQLTHFSNLIVSESA